MPVLTKPYITSWVKPRLLSKSLSHPDKTSQGFYIVLNLTDFLISKVCSDHCRLTWESPPFSSRNVLERSLLYFLLSVRTLLWSKKKIKWWHLQYPKYAKLSNMLPSSVSFSCYLEPFSFTQLTCILHDSVQEKRKKKWKKLNSSVISSQARDLLGPLSECEFPFFCVHKALTWNFSCKPSLYSYGLPH